MQCINYTYKKKTEDKVDIRILRFYLEFAEGISLGAQERFLKDVKGNIPSSQGGEVAKQWYVEREIPSMLMWRLKIERLGKFQDEELWQATFNKTATMPFKENPEDFLRMLEKMSEIIIARFLPDL